MRDRIIINGVLYESINPYRYHGWDVDKEDDNYIWGTKDSGNVFLHVDYTKDEKTGNAIIEVNIPYNDINGKKVDHRKFTTKVGLVNNSNGSTFYKFLDYLDNIIEEIRNKLTSEVEEYLKWINSADAASIFIGPSKFFDIDFDEYIRPKIMKFRG